MDSTDLKRKPGRVILLLALACSIVASYILISPYLQPIVIALLFGLMAHPLHQRIQDKLGGRANLAATISCLLLTFVILLPLLFVLMAILSQAVVYSTTLLHWVQSGGFDQLLAHPWVSKLHQLALDVLPLDKLKNTSISQDLIAAASKMGKNALGISAEIAGDVTHFIFSFVLMLFVLFFILRDYDSIVRFFHHALPLSRSQEEILMREIKTVSKSALLGSFLTAVTQGIAGGIGFWIVGIPGLFWGSIMAFASLIPVVGTALIWVPAVLFLFITGQWQWGIFLLAWSILIVGSIDNFLRPWFMQGAASMGTVVIFFSLMGGISMFGLMGLIYGPLVIAITLVLFHLYETEFKDFLDYQDRH
ncbi:AI-2E family transporter [Dongshaea marina]|uniref:AI-2E family transporter n=1 Tax=Dongshaea marina TaxID=2047966 RepID=UPI000D3E7487|nr:AI-2E family transporter [Dongshaea marina]